MIYIFRIRPFVRLFLVICILFLSYLCFKAGSQIEGYRSIAPTLFGFVALFFALNLIPHLGDILRAYLETWRRQR